MANRRPERILRIAAPSDRLLTQWVSKVMSKLDGQSEITLAGNVVLMLTSHEWRARSEKIARLNTAIGKGRGSLITTVSIIVGNTRAEFTRGITSYKANQGYIVEPSLSEAEIFFDDHSSGEVSYDLDVRSVANEIFLNPNPRDLIGPKAISAISKEVAELSGLSRKIVEDLFESQKEVTTKLSERRRQLEQGFLEKEKLLESEFKLRNDQFDNRVEELNSRESSLRLQEFKHERREIRNSITNKIQDRLQKGRSRSSLVSRLAVLMLCALGALIGSGLAYTAAVNGSVSSLLSDGVSVGEAVDLFKIIGGGLISITLIFYALNFWRKKVDEDERHERLLERYSLDIDRGSWIVETVLDIRSENPDAEIPDLWLQGVSSGLFPSSSDSSEHKEDAVDALGVLLKKGAHFKLGPNGAEFELSEKAAKRVGRDAD